MIFRLLLASFLLASVPHLHAQETSLTPERSAERIKLPDGFRATLFAGEPDVIKPIAMTTDDRGRSLTNSSERLQ